MSEGIILTPDISEEEMDTMRKGNQTYSLLEAEKNVPIEILSARQNTLDADDASLKWRFDVPRKMVIFNVKWAISEDHDGLNSSGRRGDMTGGFALTEDGTMIDWDLAQNRTNRARFTRDLLPFFGGWSAKDAGSYPVQPNGTLVCPTYLVGNDTEFEQRLKGATAFMEVKKSADGAKNYFSYKPVAQ